ncbi:MAG: Single-stranded DNA-specific exonuclease [candidate division WWE3 bacterium GW2011_GWA2_44_16]|uniref:Single-stranded-DNA-specific exonuclease RecJ n=1 Tax=candidate division WWE3 bacterium GW2011_GWA2_44_16 TaxID=1619110 RepID=A0A0G1HEI4_UNCKA|nr:MAG: Single-stranded DNA-specific exonuclease [candidate division WWE3 bacterium GW2011_GWA2_44_16]
MCVYQPGVDVVSELLKNRGIAPEDKAEFLAPAPLAKYIKELSADFRKALVQAKDLILKAIAKDVPIVIHGDYDADGICATAILYQTLTQTLGYTKTMYFLPNRFDQGYGLSKDSVDTIWHTIQKTYGTKSGLIIPGLIITVDCGITAEPEVIHQLKALGLDIIITDHHQKKSQQPKADVLVWTDQMVGSGVALALSLVLGLRDERLVSLAGLATITDLGLLKGFNRALVRKALEILNTNPPLGIKKLLEVSGRTGGEITTYDAGYVIGPRLNASGRLESAYASLFLLLDEDPQKVTEFAQKLHVVNIERQDMTQKLYSLAQTLLTEQKSLENKIVICSHKDFHEGVIGLVAGKLAQSQHRPAVVISSLENGGKGSARSVPGLNIIDLLRSFEHLFESMGGHPMAAGFTLKKGMLDQFIQEFTAHANKVVDAALLIPTITVDMEIPLPSVTVDFVCELNRLRPFGVGNPEPVFLSRAVSVVGNDFVGREGNHLSLKLFAGAGQTSYKAIYFDARNQGVSTFGLGTKLDLVYSLALKDYNGKSYVDLIVKDFRIL